MKLCLIKHAFSALLSSDTKGDPWGIQLHNRLGGWAIPGARLPSEAFKMQGYDKNMKPFRKRDLKICFLGTMEYAKLNFCMITLTQSLLTGKVKCNAQLPQSCPTLCNPMDCTPPGSLSLVFSRQEYWSGLPCPPLGDLPNPGIKPRSPAFQVGVTIWVTRSTIHTHLGGGGEYRHGLFSGLGNHWVKNCFPNSCPDLIHLLTHFPQQVLDT